MAGVSCRWDLQATYVNDYSAIDTDGIVAQRTVGIEVSDSAIPEIQANMQLGWRRGGWDVSWSMRYIDAVKEYCGNALTTAVPGCDNDEEFHELGSTFYNDLQVGVEQRIRRRGPEAAARREQHLRGRPADLLQLLAERLRRGHL